jgi:DNA polymerase elongation subunit (family B)
MDLGSCVKFEGEEIKDDRFTTDHVVNLTSISKTNDFKPPLKIMSFDIENSIKTQQLYVIGYTIKFKDKEKNGSITGEPTDILKRFIEVVRENDPDIITGYNIDGYDLPFLSDLAKNNNIKMQLSRDDQEPKRVQNQFWKINGRVVADAWWNVKRRSIQNKKL